MCIKEMNCSTSSPINTRGDQHRVHLTAELSLWKSPSPRELHNQSDDKGIPCDDVTDLINLRVDFLSQRSLEQLHQEVLLSGVGCVVEDSQDDVVHELGGFGLGQLKDETSKVVRVGLQQIEEVLVVLWHEGG